MPACSCPPLFQRDELKLTLLGREKDEGSRSGDTVKVQLKSRLVSPGFGISVTLSSPQTGWGRGSPEGWMAVCPRFSHDFKTVLCGAVALCQEN